MLFPVPQNVIHNNKPFTVTQTVNGYTIVNAAGNNVNPNSTNGKNIIQKFQELIIDVGEAKDALASVLLFVIQHKANDTLRLLELMPGSIEPIINDLNENY